MVEIGQKTADATANWLEIHRLARCPWPAEMTVDKGREFAREGSETLQNKHGIEWKIIASRNPQSNSMIERCHKTLHNMIRSAQIKDKTRPRLLCDPSCPVQAGETQCCMMTSVK